jgi:uncharacterized alkaline shock family protein YloU
VNTSGVPETAVPEPVTAWQLEPAGAEIIARAVSRCPSVARLSPGVTGEVATYLVGRRVIGVRFRETIEVHVVARYGVTVEHLAAEVRAAVASLVAPPTDVYVDDLDVELEGVRAGEEMTDGARAASTR